MKINPAVRQNYANIASLRQHEQVQIKHQQNLKKLQEMQRQTVETVQAHRATQHMEANKFDRLRQISEAYLGQQCQKDGHNQTMNHVDVKV